MSETKVVKRSPPPKAFIPPKLLPNQGISSYGTQTSVPPPTNGSSMSTSQDLGVLPTPAEIAKKNAEDAPRNPFDKTPVKYERLNRKLAENEDYRELEALGRKNEKEGRFPQAKIAFKLAQNQMARTLSIDAEEKALEAGNILSKEAYEAMSSGDKTCWDLRGLKPFKHYTQFNPQFFWFEQK